ncbi:hypothetical protein BHE74_00013871 [Ensete ventricosum]|nr:hypothetical protein BHE74_00013871 [Ensete ventricosum]
MLLMSSFSFDVGEEQADASDAVDVGVAQPKKRTFRKFSYRGVDLDQLLDMGLDELVKLFDARARRRFRSLSFGTLVSFLDVLMCLYLLIVGGCVQVPKRAEEETHGSDQEASEGGMMPAFVFPLFSFVFKRDAPPGEKPEPVRTHLRNMIIVPEMIGSIIGVYNGKTFNQVEIKVTSLFPPL